MAIIKLMTRAPTAQRHLSHGKTVNLGGYYTNPRLVGIAYALLARHAIPLTPATCLLDTSCGYGSFLSHPAAAAARLTGADIDPQALALARLEVPAARFIRRNGLLPAARKAYKIPARAPLVIVGNPPYNDLTALSGRAVKKGEASPHVVAPRYKSRDLGLSFMRAYADIAPDFVCVLHPLSYLIKKTNFTALKTFARSYALLDAVVVSSAEFTGTARGDACFPIAVALYARRAGGMDWEHVRQFAFKTDCGKTFRVADFTPLCDYVDFYPNAKKVPLADTVARFHTLRDINALRRNRAFVDTDGPNTVRITPAALPYYVYAAEFKRRIAHLPYYLGNFPVFIDHAAFEKIKDCFETCAAPDNSKRIDAYFRQLLGEHRVP